MSGWPFCEPKPKSGCSHRRYSMTCADYQDLYIRAEGRCEICRTPEPFTAQRWLHTDHDWTRGQWAVRGLLCQSCNVNLDRIESALHDAADRYLANPWVDERFGRYVEVPPEPAVGCSVHIRLPRRTWVRRRDAWHSRGGYKMQPKLTWEQLTYRYAPHRMIGHAPDFTDLPPRASQVLTCRLEAVS